MWTQTCIHVLCLRLEGAARQPLIAGTGRRSKGSTGSQGHWPTTILRCIQQPSQCIVHFHFHLPSHAGKVLSFLVTSLLRTFALSFLTYSHCVPATCGLVVTCFHLSVSSIYRFVHFHSLTLFLPPYLHSFVNKINFHPFISLPIGIW